MDLVLVRHAIAFTRDPLKWPDDRERPLTAEGEKRFRQAARGLRAMVSDLDVVLSSPLTRAWHTAVILHEEAGWPDPIRFDALEPGRDPAEVVSALEPYRHAGAVALVGHEPNLSDLAAFLLAGDDRPIGLTMKKGGVACLRLAGPPGPGAGELRWWVMPKTLRALAKVAA